ncbi:MAG: hypothetical protein ABI627_00705 [Polyangiaceae bacterium]
MTEPHWTEVAARLAQVFAAFATVGGGAWGLKTYGRTSKRQSAEWIQGVFEKFQLGTEFDEAKVLFDFQYDDVVEPMLAAMVSSGNSALAPEERERSQPPSQLPRNGRSARDHDHTATGAR